MEYDGFFIALIQKDGSLKNVDINKVKKNEKLERLLSDIFTGFDLTDLLYMKNNKIFINPLLRFQDVTFPKILFKNNDFLLATFQKDFMISTEGAWEFGNRIREERRAKIGKEESIEYLNGFDINKEIMIENGVLFYGDIPVGPFKMVDKRIKNKIDRYFIYNRV
jgi:16S rRNA (cytosine1407-C5)-methyltransferase